MTTESEFAIDDNDVYALIWKLIAGLAALFMLCVTSCSMHQNYLVESALAHGTDPLLVKCAFGAAGSQECVLAASRPE